MRFRNLFRRSSRVREVEKRSPAGFIFSTRIVSTRIFISPTGGRRGFAQAWAEAAVATWTVERSGTPEPMVEMT